VLVIECCLDWFHIFIGLFLGDRYDFTVHNCGQVVAY
jgi:hypothetical protein